MGYQKFGITMRTAEDELQARIELAKLEEQREAASRRNCGDGPSFDEISLNLAMGRAERELTVIRRKMTDD